MNLTDELTDKLESMIVTGRWAVGEKLPPLRELGERYCMSRSVVNAAVASLESSGYIEIKPRKGAVVKNWRKEGTLAVLRGMAKSDAYDNDTLNSLLRCRLLILTECAEVAAENADAKRVLKELLKEGQQAISTAEWVSYDMKFHRTVVGLSGNVIWHMVIKEFEKATACLVEQFYMAEGVRGFILKKHEEICQAVSDGDGKIAKIAMRELLRHGERIILKQRKGGDYGKN